MKSYEDLSEDDNFNLALRLFNRITYWDKPAYFYNDDSVTFSEIRKDVESLSTSLRRCGVKNRDRVLLFMNDTPMFFIAFLSSLQIGAIPISLNPKSKNATIIHYLNDSGATTVIGQQECLNTVAEINNIKNLNLVTIVEDVYSERTTNQFISLKSLLADEPSKEYTKLEQSDVAFMQYTSGTTGNPKAVMHHGNSMLAHAETYGKNILNVGDDDIVYSVAKVFFGYGLGNSLFLPFFFNLTAVIDYRWPSTKIVAHNLLKYRPTIFFSIPKIYSDLLEYGEDLERFFPGNVRLISAGSPLPSSLYCAWWQRHGVKILDGIGTTEMGHIYLTTTLTHSKATCVPGYEVQLDEDKYSVSTKPKRGTLKVKGPSQAIGYYNNDKKTRGKFSEDGWFRTGDIFSQDEEGNFTFEGREDDLFKVKGRWVSPLDVENFVLNNFRSVDDVVLVGNKKITPDPDLSLFIVKKDGVKDSDMLCNNIVELLKECFETHCIPKNVTILNEMPRNDNGKILRHKLACHSTA